MNLESSHETFGWGAAICVAGLLLNLGLIAKRGLGAKVRAGAFVSLGVGLGLLYADAAPLFAVPFGAIAGGLLVLDALLKIRGKGARR